MTIPMELRFWSKVNIRRNDECWRWLAANKRGYGKFWQNGQMREAHRISWEMRNGPIPKNLEICHRCDNPPCVNPRHLFLGNHFDNMKDMVRKNRSAKGENHSQVKLTAKAVAEIKNRLKNGIAQKHLAQEFGVNKSTIYAIKHNFTWSYI